MLTLILFKCVFLLCLYSPSHQVVSIRSSSTKYWQHTIGDLKLKKSKTKSLNTKKRWSSFLNTIVIYTLLSSIIDGFKWKWENSCCSSGDKKKERKIFRKKEQKKVIYSQKLSIICGFLFHLFKSGLIWIYKLWV